MGVIGLCLEFSPVVVRQMCAGTTDEELRSQLDGVAEHLAETNRQGLRTVVIVDVTKATRSTPAQRRIDAEWRTRHDAMIRRTSLGAAIVVPDQFTRGALSAMLWLRPPPNGHLVTLSLEDAVEWAVARLASHGIAIPDRLVHDRARAVAKIRAMLR